VYKRDNIWNNNTDTGNIMHLIQRNNTLSAEVDLGQRATVLRKRADDTPITDPVELITCSANGNSGRNSDPVIGSAINALAWGGSKLTIRDPVGLYFHSVDLKNVTREGDDDFDPEELWTWVRGRRGTYMRAVFEVPEGRDYVLGDLLVDGIPLKWGGQIADLIKISLTGRTSDTGGENQILPRICGADPMPRRKSEAVAMSNTASAEGVLGFR